MTALSYADQLEERLVQVRAHRDRLADELRALRDEHAGLLRQYAKASDALEEVAAQRQVPAVLDSTQQRGVVLVDLDAPGRMVTITSTPYTEDVPDEQSDQESAEQQEARRAARDRGRTR